MITLAVLFVLGCGEAPEAEQPLDPEVVALIHDLVDGTDYEKRMAALEKLPAHGTAIVKPLADALDREDVDDAVGAWIAEALARLGADAVDAAPALTRRLMRGGACSATTSHALEMMGAQGVPWLVQAMASTEENTLVWTADALSDLETLSAPAVGALHAALADERPAVRGAAADALRAIGPAADAAVPDLYPLTRHDDEELRMSAGSALAAIRGTDPMVQSCLRRMVREDPDEYVRTRMLEALGPVLGRDPESLAFLRQVAAAPEDEYGAGAHAKGMLLERGVDDPALIAEMTAGYEDEGFEDALATADLLARAGPNGRSAALPLLIRVLEWSPQESERVAAARALGDLGRVAAASPAALAALGKHTKDEDEEPEVVAACKAALEKIGNAR